MGRLTLRARWTDTDALDGMLTSGWTTLVDGPASVADFMGEWHLDFNQPWVRPETGNLVLDLVLEGVEAPPGVCWSGMVTSVQTAGPNMSPRGAGAAQWVDMTGTTAWN